LRRQNKQSRKIHSQSIEGLIAMVLIHILNLDDRITFGKHSFLPSCHVRKKDKDSIINIDGENYDEAILISLPILLEVAKRTNKDFLEQFDECITHELTHNLMPEWKHGHHNV
jgi:hypothetical protein